MDDNTPTPVGPALPEIIEQLRLGQPERAQRLMEALRGDGGLNSQQLQFNRDLHTLATLRATAIDIAESEDADPLLADFAAEVDEVLRGLPNPIRARQLMAAVQGQGQPACICGEHDDHLHVSGGDGPPPPDDDLVTVYMQPPRPEL